MELPPAIISWPWARRMLAEPVGGRGALWTQEWKQGPKDDLPAWSPGLGFTGGREGRKRFVSAYYVHMPSKHFTDGISFYPQNATKR